MRKTAKRLSDYYGDNDILKPQYFSNDNFYAWFQKRHQRQTSMIGEDGVYRSGEHEWKVPLGVRLCLKNPLVWTQIVRKTKWYVTWKSPRTGKRYKKYFASAMAGIHFIATKAQYVDKHACLVTRMGYDIPAPLRGKIPLPWKWCPMCMTARRFKRTDDQTFFGERKEWDEVKQHYVWKERKLALLRCPYCGCTNRDTKMRRSNQPWEVRKFKKGVRRARRIKSARRKA